MLSVNLGAVPRFPRYLTGLICSTAYSVECTELNASTPLFEEKSVATRKCICSNVLFWAPQPKKSAKPSTLGLGNLLATCMVDVTIQPIVVHLRPGRSTHKHTQPRGKYIKTLQVKSCQPAMSCKSSRAPNIACLLNSNCAESTPSPNYLRDGQAFSRKFIHAAPVALAAYETRSSALHNFRPERESIRVHNTIQFTDTKRCRERLLPP